eukprot:13294627-Alexandrium_andersonii.AAC.1
MEGYRANAVWAETDPRGHARNTHNHTQNDTLTHGHTGAQTPRHIGMSTRAHTHIRTKEHHSHQQS